MSYGFEDCPGPEDWEAAKELAEKARADERRKVWREAAEIVDDQAQIERDVNRGNPDYVSRRIASIADKFRAKAEEEDNGSTS